MNQHHAQSTPDGTLGAWTTSTSLPGTVYGSQAVVTKTQVYLLGGGINGSASSTVYTAPIGTSAQEETNMHPDQRSVKQVMTDRFHDVANNNFNLTFTSIAEGGREKNPAATNEEGLCLTIQSNDPAVKPVSGNRYAPVETVYFVDPSDTISDTVKGISDPLVVTLARLWCVTFIVHSVNGVNHYHVLETNLKMVGLSQEVVCDKVLYWAKIGEGIPELTILDTPNVDPENGWTQEDDLLYYMLPLKREGDKLDPVLEAALRCAPKEALKLYFTWAEEFHYCIYPGVEETLSHLQGD